MLNAFCLFALEQLYLYLKLHGNVKRMKKKKKVDWSALVQDVFKYFFEAGFKWLKHVKTYFFLLCFYILKGVIEDGPNRRLWNATFICTF